MSYETKTIADNSNITNMFISHNLLYIINQTENSVISFERTIF